MNLSASITQKVLTSRSRATNNAKSRMIAGFPVLGTDFPSIISKL